MILDLTSLQSAISALERSVVVFQMAAADPAASVYWETLRAGVIQHFEFTYELCWKFMQRWLEEERGSATVVGLPRRELFRVAAEERLISDVVPWFNYARARNQTVHTYNQEVAEDVLGVSLRFVVDANAFGKELARRNAQR